VTRKQSFWWGAFGSCIPDVIRFFKVAAIGGQFPHLNWPVYFALLALFIVFAGGFTVAWKPESEFKAIWVGASFPTLVAIMLQAAPSLPSH
jgi:hypothetical protein